MARRRHRTRRYHHWTIDERISRLQRRAKGYESYSWKQLNTEKERLERFRDEIGTNLKLLREKEEYETLTRQEREIYARYENRGCLLFLFIGMSPDDKRRAEEIRERIESSPYHRYGKYSLDPNTGPPSEVVKSYDHAATIDAALQKIQDLMPSAKQRYETYLARRNAARARREEAEEEKRNREERIIAMAVRSTEKTRELAAQKKRTLVRQQISEWKCPYCGEDLGDSPHADHIYPVSKGGLSTIENMVLVCESCNAAKSDCTLNEFIEGTGLNRDEAFRRLRSLGKDF